MNWIFKESLFLDNSEDDLAETFGEWVSAFTDMDEFVEKAPAILKDMQKRSLCMVHLKLCLF